ncbi:hypothetical protein [Geothrix mesophila]|uniref:hypothetical protein n=1 Tax=Geothrix mesophila TaxID=2922723 RepID=UPI001FACB4F7|nr:hypothetical protein [Geothrix sp. SG198]
MPRIHDEKGHQAERLASAPPSQAVRTLIRGVAFLCALLLLQALLSCRRLNFTGTSLEEDRLTTLKTFCIDSQPDSALCIWNMRTIPFEELKPLVSDRLMEKGYRMALPQEADFQIVLTTFTEESSPRTRVPVMEIFERHGARKLWWGHAEIPYKLDPRQGVRDQPALTGLLDLIPPHTESDRTPSRSMLRD